jgi:MFS family permease
MIAGRMLRTAPSWLKALLAGQVVSSAGALAWIYLTLYLVSDRGVAPHTAGLVAAAYGLFLVAGNLTGGSLGDRIGHRPALAVALAGWAVFSLAFPITPTPALAAIAAGGGLAAGAVRPLMSALVVSSLPAAMRREGIALSRAAMNAGTVIGPPLGGLLAATDFNLVFVVDGVSSLLLLAVILRFVPAARPAAASAAARRGVLHALRTDSRLVVLLATVVVVDTVYRLLYSVLPLLLRDLGTAAWVYGLTITLNCVVIVLFEPPLARRLSSRPALAVIGAGYALVGIGFAELGASPAVATAFVAVAIVTLGEMLYKPTATAHAADLAPVGMTGRYQSLYAGASIGGMLLSPLLGTAGYEAAPRAVWPVAALLALGAAGVVVAFAARTVPWIAGEEA